MSNRLVYAVFNKLVFTAQILTYQDSDLPLVTEKIFKGTFCNISLCFVQLSWTHGVTNATHLKPAVLDLQSTREACKVMECRSHSASGEITSVVGQLHYLAAGNKSYNCSCLYFLCRIFVYSEFLQDNALPLMIWCAKNLTTDILLRIYSSFVIFSYSLWF